MESFPSHFPDDCIPAIHKIHTLAHYPRYIAAFVFGSLSRGQATRQSDIDVKVVVQDTNTCSNINHPTIHATRKADVSFVSFTELLDMTEQQIRKGEREPLIARACMIFDKTGATTQLRDKANAAQPRKYDKEHYQTLHFLVYHANDKVQRHIHTLPSHALFAMHTGLSDLLQIYYRIQGFWWVSSKWLLADLKERDILLYEYVSELILSTDVHQRFRAWSAIVNYILASLGGHRPINENSCTCAICQEDLSRLTLHEEI